MGFLEKRGNILLACDYRRVVPLLGRLPLAVGQAAAMLRGLVQAACDYDWRSIAVGFPYIRSRTYTAMGMIRPEKGRMWKIRKTAERFMHNSKEEWQACLFGQVDRMRRIEQNSAVDGLDALLDIQRQGRGVVMVGCHLDSFCMGMVLMGMKGLRVHIINTVAIEDERIQPDVRAFFQRKYRAMERLLNGLMAYHETEMPHFYGALERGETVCLMGDVPGSKSDVWIPFLGTRLRMPVGAWHMAKRTGSLVAAFVAVQEGVGRYRVVTLPPREIDPESPEKTLVPLYRFLEVWLRRMPERWVSADLLPAYS
ncbi:lysophospholipid acyltransferase family protein [Desulfatirhabdium butyrativorans]|uniref:lysophospholipid acyltransferase family protein n=1 Tax=Desulfatirhabdium butyrativorans TaxID=340467 RepID=UPI000406F55C|nr:lysophospholipid acyltransferase family protein [Desulfatirhabdium butyrativorans]